jgi:hypothetical protein
MNLKESGRKKSWSILKCSLPLDTRVSHAVFSPVASGVCVCVCDYNLSGFVCLNWLALWPVSSCCSGSQVRLQLSVHEYGFSSVVLEV